MDLVFLKLGNFGSVIAHTPKMSLPLDLLQYKIEHITVLLLHVKFVPSTGIFYRGLCVLCLVQWLNYCLYISLYFGTSFKQ